MNFLNGRVFNDVLKESAEKTGKSYRVSYNESLTRDGTKMVAGRVDTKPAQAIP